MIARAEHLALPPEERAGGSRHVGIAPLQRLAARLLAIGPLAALLALQTLGSLTLRNTAFQDEALYLYAGRQIVDWLRGGPAVTEAYATYFSGLPRLYPVLAGLLARDDLDGHLSAQSLVRGRVDRAEHGLLPGLALDVGNAPRVPRDGQAGLGRLGALQVVN